MAKSPFGMSLDERKAYLINVCYIDMADKDYVCARWSYTNGIFHNFYWCSAQAIEKYLKASLLYNNRTSKGYGHDLSRLFKDVVELDSEGLLPHTIALPDTTGAGREAWHGKAMDSFIDYIATYGSPDNRYGLNGTFINGPVIHVLDTICSRLRAFIRRSNFFGSDLFEKSTLETSCHSPVYKDCDWMINPELTLEELYAGKFEVGHTEQLRDAFFNMNLSFVDERSKNEKTFGGLHFIGSPLLNHLVRLKRLDDSEENLRVIGDLRVWAEGHMHLPKEVREYLEKNA